VTDYFSFIKSESRSWFSPECAFCFQQKNCISASAFSRDKRKHLLHIRGFREKQTEAMLKGTEMHKDMQTGVPTIDEYGIDRFRSDLRSGKMIMLKEVKCHSRFFGFRGFMDLFGIRFNPHTRRMDVWIMELKTSFRKDHLFQLCAYSKIASDPNFSIIHNGGDLRVYPRTPISLNIHLGMWISRFKKMIKWEYMENGNIVGQWRGYGMALARRARSLRSVHKMGVYNVAEIPACRNCYEKCGFYRSICSKIADVEDGKSKQKYFGRRKMLVNKPRLK